MLARAATTSPADRQNRSRKWHHKVKSGCLTCKIRRVKCTEERPACIRCLAAGRECTYGAQPREREVQTTSPTYFNSATTLALLKPKDYATSSPEELRALEFFLQVTAPTAATYNVHTKDFFGYLIPQVAQSEAAVRHLAVAVAAQHESMSSSTDTALALSRVQKKHYIAGLNELSRGKNSSEEVVLLASALFIVLGQLEAPEQQTAQCLFHLMASLRILIERLDHEKRKPSSIIDIHIQPIYARLELMMSSFMMPVQGTDAVTCVIEPQEPVVPEQFSDLREARELWCSIVCWRYRKEARTQPWTSESPCFQEIRGLLLKWNNLTMAYAGKAAFGSPHELHRTITMISQFRLLFLAMMFSVRHDLHLPDQVRPSFVNLLHPGEVSLTYQMPPRTLRMIPKLDWESTPYDDALQNRLWPIAEAAKRTETAGLTRVTFKV